MAMFEDKVLLITGGTGSFGNEVLKNFKKKKMRKIIVFSRDEKKQDDMRKAMSDERVEFILGDVRSRESVSAAMQGVDYVFHAAALKQVPSCEFFPMEAVKTNIHGTENVLKEAILAGVQKVCVLSTDKAVYPINSMGMTKAIAEKIVTSYAKRPHIARTTQIFATRYGNVMGSRGSVIPLFRDQAMSKRDLTITNPQMTRFLMSLEQSVELVEFAFENAEAGDIFVNKAPAANIQDIAKAVIQLTASPSSTKVIGTRHGEKLYESLVALEEMQVAQDFGEFYRIPVDGRNLNYEKYFEEGVSTDFSKQEFHSHNARQLSVDEICKLISQQEFWNRKS